MKRLLIVAALLLMACTSNPAANEGEGPVTIEYYVITENSVEATFYIFDSSGNEIVESSYSVGNYKSWTVYLPDGNYSVICYFNRVIGDVTLIDCGINTNATEYFFSVELTVDNPSAITGNIPIEVY